MQIFTDIPDLDIIHAVFVSRLCIMYSAAFHSSTMQKQLYFLFRDCFQYAYFPYYNIGFGCGFHFRFASNCFALGSSSLFFTFKMVIIVLEYALLLLLVGNDWF